MSRTRSAHNVAHIDTGLPGQMFALEILESNLREIDLRLRVRLAGTDTRLSDASAEIELQIADLRAEMTAQIERATGLSAAQLRSILN